VGDAVCNDAQLAEPEVDDRVGGAGSIHGNVGISHMILPKFTGYPVFAEERDLWSPVVLV